MKNYYWGNEYYRNYDPFYFYCPYCQPSYEGNERFGEYESSEDFLVRYPLYVEDNFRANDIEKITKVIYKEISRDLKFIESLPMGEELMHYVIKVIANYIDKNHGKFLDPIEIKIQGLMKALRKDLYWVFEIMELFGVEHEEIISFIENVVRVFLREIIQENSKEQNSPMWGN